MAKEIQPSLNEEAFNCPRCGVLCPHKHYEVQLDKAGLSYDISLMKIATNEKIDIGNYPRFVDPGNTSVGEELRHRHIPWDLYITLCTHCREYTIWENQNMIFPFETSISEASPDMPEIVRSIYVEAQLVYQHSPRASAALLRLAIETLIPELHYDIKKDTLYNMIGKLVEQDIPPHIQKGLDSLRYYGNNGIHTAEIDMQDDRDTVVFLFKLCNMIVDDLISKKNEVNDFYEALPERFRSSVSNRDKIKRK